MGAIIEIAKKWRSTGGELQQVRDGCILRRSGEEVGF